jgi:hypothetical protein
MSIEAKKRSNRPWALLLHSFQELWVAWHKRKENNDFNELQEFETLIENIKDFTCTDRR